MVPLLFDEAQGNTPHLDNGLSLSLKRVYFSLF